MAFFDSFTDSIKQKWLQFFKANRDWITLQMAIESVYTPDGGKRPSSFLILGVVNALEPKLAQLMFPFAKLNPDADTLIEVLGLHFDPDIVLGNRLSPMQEPEIYSRASQEVTEEWVEDETAAVANFSVVEEEVAVEDFAVDEIDEDSFKHEVSFSQETIVDEFQSTPDLDADSDAGDDFGQMSFDSVSEDSNDDGLGDFNLSDDNEFDELNQPDENEFRDVMSDVWGDETSLDLGEDNNNLLGEELPSEVFDESEMARLFPNS